MIKVGVVGASGYTGFELVRILERHPHVEFSFVTSETHAGGTLDALHPTAPALPLTALEETSLSSADVVFLCLPHGVAAPVAIEALAEGCRVIDLSADFRLRDQQVYTQWYGVEHPSPNLLGESVYGLTEFARERLPGARLVANPGCYPTSILLPLHPLFHANLVAGQIIADSKSGVSGAGRNPKQHTHFVEVADNFSPYNIGRAHRHLPEIEQELIQWQSEALPLIFSPHLLPVPRGILSTIYVPLRKGTTAEHVREVMCTAFEGEPFVTILPSGVMATLAHVNGTNRCVIGLAQADDVLIITSAIDNLIKGAAGQAVQNMNVVLRLPETAGLV